MERKSIRIYSYNRIWKVENKVYAVGNFVLPVPVNLTQIGYLLIAILAVLLISAILPFLKDITFIIRLGLLPFFLSRFLSRKKLDGKNPIKYFFGVLIYLFQKNTVLDRLMEKREEKGNVNLTWCCSKGKGGS